MARMRQIKNELKAQLQSEHWQTFVSNIAKGGMAHVGPLFSMLLLGPMMLHRAAYCLGATCAQLAEETPEQARIVMRRFMWHMNEESGNIGWGIPESFGESLAQSSLLAKEYHRVLISYIMDTQQEDNFCDNDLLRRSCFWAVGRLAQARPDLCANARTWLVKGLEDQDIPCRGMAAWALGQLPASLMDAPALRRLAESNVPDVCILFDGHGVIEKSVTAVAREVLAK